MSVTAGRNKRPRRAISSASQLGHRWSILAVLLLPLIGLAASSKVTGLPQNASLITQPAKPNQTLDETSPDFNSPSGVIALNERLVAESKLQAEESRSDEQVGARLPAPRAQQHHHQQQHQAPLERSSAGSYWSLSRDGSHRYQFGFDTERQQEGAESAGLQAADEGATGGKRKARLMREESRLADGTVIGRYGYTDPFNVFRVVQYVAGEDGYFAAEDVGAVDASTATKQSPLLSGNFELNKQLHKALQQAKAKRLLAAASSQPEAPTSRPSERLLSSSPADSDLASSGSSSAPSEALAASSSGQSFQFATRIDHLLGSDGHSYATAFRPPRQSPPAPVVESRYEQLRSRLPAPISTPQNEFTYSHFAQDQAPAPVAVQHWAPPAAGQVQASPAWNLLDQNYNRNLDQAVGQILLVQHGDGHANADIVSRQLASDISANFHHEAQILSQLSSPNSQRFGARSVLTAQQPPRLQQQVLPRQQAPLGHSDYTGAGASFGFALNHLDPPLYRPEVHETEPSALDVASGEPAASFLSRRSGESLQELASVDSKQPSDLPPPPPPVASTAPRFVGHAMILDHSTAELTRAKQQVGPAVKSSQDVPRYATRLAPAQADHPDMDAEMSEQVAAYLAAGNSTASNGTRARVPTSADRSKKIMSIFKARGSSGHANNAEALKIRRPVAKKEPNSLLADGGQPESVVVVPVGLDSSSERPAVKVEEQAQNNQQVSASVVPTTQAPASKALFGRKFGKSHHTVGADEASKKPLEVQKAIGAAKKRPNLRDQGQSIVEQLPATDQTVAQTTPLPSSTTAGRAEASTTKPPKVSIIELANLHEQQQSNNDSSRHDGHPTLIEKVMQIERELMKRQQQQQPSNRSSSTPESSDREASGAGSASLTSPSSNSNSPSEAPQTTTSATDVAKQTTEVAKLATSESSSPASAVSSPTTEAVKPASKSDKPVVENKFMTGTLMNMDQASGASDFLASLARDMDSFDSARSSTNSADSGGPDLKLSAIRSDHTEPSSTRAATIASDKPRIFTNTIDDNQSSRTTTTTTAEPVAISSSSSLAPDTTISSVTTIQPSVEQLTNRQASPSPISTTTAATSSVPAVDSAPVSVSVEASQAKPISIPDLQTLPSPDPTKLNLPTSSAQPPLESLAAPSPLPSISPPPGTSSTSTSTSTSDPASVGSRATSISSNPTLAPMTSTVSSSSAAAVTGAPDRVTSLPPTAATSLVAQPAEGPAKMRKVGAGSRIGRLVIKRGDRVVARYNASDPIPDSLIPTGAGGTNDSKGDLLILPELPTVGMRLVKKSQRLFGAKKAAGEPTASANKTTPIATTISDNGRPNSSGLSLVAEVNQTFVGASRSLKALPSDSSISSKLKRASRLTRELSDDLMVDETQEVPEQRQAPASRVSGGNLFVGQKQPKRSQQTETAAGPSRSRNWSSRLSSRLPAGNADTDNSGQAALAEPARKPVISGRIRDPPAARKLAYDPSEELELLVDKIVQIETARVGSPGGDETSTRGKPTDATPTRADTSATSSTTKRPDGDKEAVQSVAARNASVAQNVTQLELAKMNRTPQANITLSSSAQFTLPITPELDRQWAKLRPVEAKRQLGLGGRETADAEVRVNSHGHIHVRNNQSLTVHVDISSQMAAANVSRPQPSASGPKDPSQPPRRKLSSRDTTNLEAPIPSDIRRLPADERAGGRQVEPQASEISQGEQAKQSNLAKKQRARMVCIEVESET